MGLAHRDAVLRFFQAARGRVKRAEDLAEKLRPLLGGQVNASSVNAWSRDPKKSGDRASAEAMIATAMVLKMSIDEYVGRAKGEETHEEAHARLSDTVATLERELAELRQVVGDMLDERREEDAGQSQAGQAG